MQAGKLLTLLRLQRWCRACFSEAPSWVWTWSCWRHPPARDPSALSVWNTTQQHWCYWNETRRDEARYLAVIRWNKLRRNRQWKRDRKRKDILRNGNRGRNLWWDETRRNCHKKKLKVFWGIITMAGSCDMMWHNEKRLSKGILLLLITFI